MGGWVDDQEAAATMQLATEACNNLHLDIDMQEAFVPGLRRGYLVIPYKPKVNENERAMFSRLAQAIQQVKQAKQATGAIGPNGQPKNLW